MWTSIDTFLDFVKDFLYKIFMILLFVATKVFYQTGRIAEITKRSKEYRFAFDTDLLLFSKEIFWGKIKTYAMLMPMPMVTMLIFSNGQSLVNQKAKLGISISTLVLAYSNSEIVANFRLEAWNIIRKKWRKKYLTENWPKFLKELPCRMESILNETAVLAYSECIDIEKNSTNLQHYWKEAYTKDVFL